MRTKAEHSPYLLSWLSFTKDFEKDGTTVNTDNGPNYCLHRDFYAPEEGRHFSRHVILHHNEERSRLKAHHLRKKLREDFPGRPLEFIEITTEGPSDYPALISGLQSVLKSLDTNDIHAFTPIGTTAVRYSWLYAAVNLIGGNKKLSLWHSPPPPEGADWRNTKYRYEVLPFKLSGYGLSAYAANTGSAPKPDFFEAEILKKVYREARGLGEIRNVNVLIKGETGTGKENLAREVHRSAGNKTARFEAFNCGVVTEPLIEAKLFGFEKGAHSTAEKESKGLIELADGGTLFLDEISSASPSLQSALLRVIQEKTLRRMQGEEDIKVDVRFIAADKQDLLELAEQGKFRWDLYYRLSGAQLDLPPFREWSEKDRAEISRRICRETCESISWPFPENFEELLPFFSREYKFPGNIRQLQSIIRTLCIRMRIDKRHTLSRKDLPDSAFRIDTELFTANDNFNLKRIEKEVIIKAWEHFGCNNEQTSEALGISSVSTLKTKLKSYGVYQNKTGSKST